MGFCNNNCRIMPANSHWLVIDVVSMVILYIAQAPSPAPHTFTTAYIKWTKAKIRIINMYFNIVNSGLDSEKPLPKIGNLAYHSLLSIYWRKCESRCFQISKSLWHKFSVHVGIFASSWKNGEKMIISGLPFSNISILDTTIFVCT